jgi:hypothetical protein
MFFEVCSRIIKAAKSRYIYLFDYFVKLQFDVFTCSFIQIIKLHTSFNLKPKDLPKIDLPYLRRKNDLIGDIYSIETMMGIH